jgi:hypothetical protein
LCKINLDKTTEIHANAGGCKELINMELEKMWLEVFLAYICLGRLRKTTKKPVYRNLEALFT